VTSVQKLSRIILICRQAELLAEFYTRAFGFACIEDAQKADPSFAELIGLAKGQVRTVSLRLGNQIISLAETQPPGSSYPGDVPGWDPLFQQAISTDGFGSKGQVRMSAASVGTWVPADVCGRRLHPEPTIRQHIFDAKPEREGIARLRIQDVFHHDPMRLAR